MTKSQTMNVSCIRLPRRLCSDVIRNIVSGVTLEVIGWPRVMARLEFGGVMFEVWVEASPRQLSGARVRHHRHLLAAANLILNTYQ